MGSQIREHEGAEVPKLRALLSVPSGVPGLDVSSHDGDVDWAGRYQAGYRFVWVKATEAVSYVNPFFPSQYSGSQQQGFVRGAYHFAIPNSTSGAAQAKYFSDNGGGWSGDGRTLPGALDLEWNPYKNTGGDCYGLSQAQMTSWIKDFDAYYLSRWGRYPIIYTSTSWWNECVGSSFGDTNPLWVARFATQVGPLPTGWSSHTVWQQSDAGYDQNLFNGNEAQLASFTTKHDVSIPVGNAVNVGSTVPRYTTSGAIGAKYDKMKGTLGLPVGPMVRRPDGGYYQIFQNGAITYIGTVGAHEFHGVIFNRWASLGIDAAFKRVGYATGDGSTSVPFVRGAIINNPARGQAYIVEGGIFQKFQAVGGTRSVGLPRSDMVAGRGGGVLKVNWFEAGAITWGIDRNIHVVRGGIYQKWMSQGAEKSRYGRPMTDEYKSGAQIRQDFSNKYTLVYQRGLAIKEIRS